MDLIRHLFSTEGFPTIANYGRSWEPWLIWLYISSKGVCLMAYVAILLRFGGTRSAVKSGSVDAEAAKLHMPRVLAFYQLVVYSDIALLLSQIVGFWKPAYRFIGILTAIQAACLLAAAIKTGWAYRFCVKRGGP